MVIALIRNVWHPQLMGRHDNNQLHKRAGNKELDPNPVILHLSSNNRRILVHGPGQPDGRLRRLAFR